MKIVSNEREHLTGRAGQCVARWIAALTYDLAWRFARPGAFQKRFEQAIINLPQGICLYDREDRLQLVNERFCEIYNLPMARLRIGMTFFEVMKASCAVGNYRGQKVEDVYAARKLFIDKCQRGTFYQELGEGRLVEIQHQPLSDDGWVCTYEDITEKRKERAKIEFLALHDSLTELPNRNLFGDRVRDAIAAATVERPCALLCLDLDGFKRVNDRLGHSAGDLLLKQVAGRINASSPPGATPARLGGDEFAIILPDMLPEAALRLGDRLCAAVKVPYDLAGFGSANVGASVGIAFAPYDAHQADKLLLMADRALYQSKDARRSTPKLYSEASLVPDAARDDTFKRSIQTAFNR